MKFRVRFIDKVRRLERRA